MGRCLVIVLLTAATFVVLAVAIHAQAWPLVVLLLLASILWFYEMGRPAR